LAALCGFSVAPNFTSIVHPVETEVVTNFGHDVSEVFHPSKAGVGEAQIDLRFSLCHLSQANAPVNGISPASEVKT
jgi:hypothetical protein